MSTPPSPLRGYVIGASERTGTNHLCRLLEHSGVLGHPREWLRDGRLAAEGLSDARGERLWREITARGSTDNGVFGLKVFRHHLAARPDSVVTARVLSLPVFHVHRRDRLGQAISFSRALQTGRWLGPPGEDPEPAYHRHHITYCLRRLIRHDAELRLNYAMHGSEVTEVTYEDFVADPEPVLRAIAVRVGEPDAVFDLGRGLSIQRDDRNEEWRERYLSDLRRQAGRWEDLGPGEGFGLRDAVRALRKSRRRSPLPTAIPADEREAAGPA